MHKSKEEYMYVYKALCSKRPTEPTSHGKQSESLLLRVLKKKFQFL